MRPVGTVMNRSGQDSVGPAFRCTLALTLALAPALAPAPALALALIYTWVHAVAEEKAAARVNRGWAARPRAWFRGRGRVRAKG